MPSAEIDSAKQAIRERVWACLDRSGAARPPGARGRIPDFRGKDSAARLLAQQPEWRAAQVVKANPDKAQHPVRVAALHDGKLLYMAVPRLATLEPFYRFDPSGITTPAADAVTSEGAAQHAPAVAVEAMQPVDMVICGTVAVNQSGARIGKGAGYSDIEVALLAEAGLIGADTSIVTTVHDLQVLDEELPETEHDFSVDIIITPSQVIRCGPPRRPRGLYWDHLNAAKIDAIPVLKSQASMRGVPVRQRN